MSERILEAIAVAAEMTGTTFSEPALRGMELELSAYPEAAVLAALARCRRELRHRLTLADVIERVETTDGRPSADEAWGRALLGFDENATVVLNDEIAEAMAAARPIVRAGDKVGARMAFREAYERIIAKRREERAPVNWWASLGQDASQREAAIQEAVRLGQLSAQVPALVLPPPDAHRINPEIAGRLKALTLELKTKRAA